MKLLIGTLATLMTFSAFAVQVSKCPSKLKINLENFVVYKKLATDKKFENVLIPLENFFYEDTAALSKKTTKECIYSNEEVTAVLFTKTYRDIEDGQIVHDDMLKILLRTEGLEYTMFFNITDFSKSKIEIYEDMPGKVNKKIYTLVSGVGSTALGMIDYKISVN